MSATGYFSMFAINLVLVEQMARELHNLYSWNMYVTNNVENSYGRLWPNKVPPFK